VGKQGWMGQGRNGVELGLYRLATSRAVSVCDFGLCLIFGF
jgi:hypothetical protein